MSSPTGDASMSDTSIEKNFGLGLNLDKNTMPLPVPSKMEHGVTTKPEKDLDDAAEEMNGRKSQEYFLSTFINVLVMDELETLGSVKDVLHFRNVSNEYYDFFAPTCFDLLNLYLEMSPAYRTNNLMECSIHINQRYGRLGYITNANRTEGNAHILRDLEIYNGWWYKKMDKIFIGAPKENNNLISEITLFFWKLVQPKHSANTSLTVQELLSQISPFITKLSLSEFPPENVEIILPEFLNSFSSLKILELEYSYDTEILRIPLQKLKSAIQSVDPAIQIQLIVWDYEEKYLEVLNTFGTLIKNVNIVLKLHCFSLFQFQEALNTFEWMNNAQFLLEFNVGVESIYELRTTVWLCMQHQHLLQLQGIGITMNRNGFNVENVVEMKSLLKLLSPMLTDLRLDTIDRPAEAGKKFDLLTINPGEEYNWPKLKRLSIYGYDRPLEVLKHCPSLVYLRLDVDLGSCIFHKPYKSYKDALQEYFGHMLELESVTIERNSASYFQHINLKAMFRKMYPKVTFD